MDWQLFSRSSDVASFAVASAVRGTGVGTASTLGRLFCKFSRQNDPSHLPDAFAHVAAIVSPLIGAHILANTGLNDVLYVAGAPMVCSSQEAKPEIYNTDSRFYSLVWHFCLSCYPTFAEGMFSDLQIWENSCRSSSIGIRFLVQGVVFPLVRDYKRLMVYHHEKPSDSFR
jgi:hypothetical protein